MIKGRRASFSWQAPRMFLRQKWTFGQWVLVLRGIVNNIKFRIFGPTPDLNWLEGDSNSIELSHLKLGVFLHIFYSDYISRVVELIKELDQQEFNYKLHITSPSDEILAEIKHIFDQLGNVHKDIIYRETPNKGRNFGPLLIEFGSEFEKFDYVIHLHSKGSPQYTSDRARSWSLDNWHLLGLHGLSLRRALNLMTSDKDLGYCFALNWSNTPPHSFSWGLNGALGKQIATKLGLDMDQSLNFFPAGGMFLIKPEILAEFNKLALGYGDFPEETGQLDGTPQHAIERLIGLVSKNLGLSSLVYDKSSDRFATFPTENPQRLE
jgi:lipopolysaccharide biosynthesis protein